ncbi:hypothetical protein H6764_03275 [Candidatus Nomurabacteria bacterium]|nr:hypothetical protein [Candidatus Nomurabacteria bacterium]
MMTSYDSATKCFSGQGMRSVFLGNHMNWGETGLPYFLAMTCVDCLPSPNDRAVIRSLVAQIMQNTLLIAMKNIVLILAML